MVILKETPKNESLHEATPAHFEDVIGLSGFKGCIISGPKIYVENFYTSTGTLVKGPGSVSPDDVSLVIKRAVVSFPSKDVKAIGMKSLNIMFFLKDGTTAEFFR